MKIPKNFIPNNKKLRDVIKELQKKADKNGPEKVCFFCAHSDIKPHSAESNYLYCRVKEEPVFPSAVCEEYKLERRKGCT